MSLDTRRLYELLPAVYRLRDEVQGKPLEALISLFARELGALEENLEQLYDDQFIETCAEWAAPYIGELIGYRPLHGVAARVASPRAEVANTIAYRRRKGTALMIEQLAHNVTDWPARAVEFFEQLCTTQYMNHLRPQSRATAAIRSQRAMLGVGGPFNAVAHTAEMRRPEAGSGRYNIPNIGIFLWRLQPFSLTGLPLVADSADTTGRRFRLNPLGADLQLFRAPRSESDIDHLATRANVPAPLTVREFALQVRDATRGTLAVAASDDYGAEGSVVLSRQGVDEPLRKAGAIDPAHPDALRVVRIADLRDVFDSGNNFLGWAHEDDIDAGQIALDPERGRVFLGADRAADHASAPFVARFHYASARPIGGGTYERTPAEPAAGPELTASGGEHLQPHLDDLADSGGRLLILDSRTHAQPIRFKVDGVTDTNLPGLELVVAAENGVRPLLDAPGEIELAIGARGTLVLDGLVIAGAQLRLPASTGNAPRTLVLRDCTLVPGLALKTDGNAASPGAPSLVIEHPFTTVKLERCIVGPLFLAADSDVKVEMRDCIVDAVDQDAFALAANEDGDPGAELTLRECTVIGKVSTRLMRLASNCIFVSKVEVERRQEGCMRFSHVPAESIVPRRYHCLPDAAHPDARPHFNSLRYADPNYCQLRAVTARALREGADDGGEMGVLHALHQPQRETNLRIRLDEYLRFGLHAGLFYAT